MSGHSAFERPERTAKPRESYALRLRQLAHLDVDESKAAQLWRDVAYHRRALLNRLGRDVGQRVALLDYLVNMHPHLSEPHIIERSTLEAIEYRSVTDVLTGLQNRYYFEVEMAREAERSRRYGVPVSLLLLDLDDFKHVNDSYGHRVGDEVLEKIGQLILRHVRAADVPCRYGGDEFAVLLPGTTRLEALAVSQRICADIATWFEQNPLPSGHFVDVSASGGIASFPLDDSSPEHLVQAADWALYEAKQGGGNRVSDSTRQMPIVEDVTIEG